MLRQVFYLLFIHFLLFTVIYADTVILKDGSRRNGVVLERYSDRIMFNDAEGRHEILLQNIKDIKYDSNAKNNLYLGKKYQREKKYQKALEYYEKALREDPNSKEVQNAILYSRGIIFRQRDNFNRRNLQKVKESNILAMRSRRKQTRNKKIEQIKVDYEKEIEYSLGIKIKKTLEGVTVTEVKPGSPAHWAKLRSSDKIIGIWDKLIKYSKSEDIQKMLLENQTEFSELKLKLQRRIIILRGTKYWFQEEFKIIGAELKFMPEGLVIYNLKKDGRAMLAGVEENDLVVQIEGVDTNYMSIKTIKEKIKGEEASKLELIVLRNVILRRR